MSSTYFEGRTVKRKAYYTRGSLSVNLGPVSRQAWCPKCGERFNEPRRGQNALAGTARLLGRVNKHIAERHPELLAGRPGESSPRAQE